MKKPIREERPKKGSQNSKTYEACAKYFHLKLKEDFKKESMDENEKG